jgi:hypothetical protein
MQQRRKKNEQRKQSESHTPLKRKVKKPATSIATPVMATTPQNSVNKIKNMKEIIISGKSVMKKQVKKFIKDNGDWLEKVDGKLVKNFFFFFSPPQNNAQKLTQKRRNVLPTKIHVLKMTHDCWISDVNSTYSKILINSNNSLFPNSLINKG